MIVGAIGYQCHSGLGHLMRDFFHNGVVNRVFVVRHPHYQNYTDWYPQDRQFDKARSRQFLHGLDLLLLFENAFYWPLINKAKLMGIKVVLIPNYEYTPFPI